MRIAVVQTPGTRLDEWAGTLTLIDELLVRAADLKAEVIVLPECVWPAYYLGSRQAYFAARQGGMPGPDEFLRRVGQQARANGFAVCAAYVEEHETHLYNTACWIDATGQPKAVHRKCFMWDFDHAYFEPGERIEPFDAKVRTGIMICADARLPEIPATLVARGARVLFQPTGWVNGGTSERLWNAQPDFLIAARAREFGVPIASASKWGREGPTTFVGSSMICDADGNVLVQAGQHETTVMVADVEPGTPRSAEMSATTRAALLAENHWRLPAGEVPPLHLVLLPKGASQQQVSEYQSSLPEPTLFLSAATLPVKLEEALPDTMQRCLDGPTTQPLTLNGVSITAASDIDSRGFARIRAQALQGIHLAVIFGNQIANDLVRARACENRIFVAWVRDTGVTIVDPRGLIQTEQCWPRDLADLPSMWINVSTAADKEVAPGTNMITGRCPAQYEF
ncbi:MAG: carbon-nitrogen hydrolase family protein [Planctomycetota bacterium]